jgi:hypothetical protein
MLQQTTSIHRETADYLKCALLGQTIVATPIRNLPVVPPGTARPEKRNRSHRDRGGERSRIFDTAIRFWRDTDDRERHSANVDGLPDNTGIAREQLGGESL